MLKIVRPKFSVKEYIAAWAERKGYTHYSPKYTSDKMLMRVQKTTQTKGWFGDKTYCEDVLKYYYYDKLTKAAAKEIEVEGENLEGKKLYWLRSGPTYFNSVEVLAEEINAEFEDSKDRVVLVTMEKK